MVLSKIKEFGNIPSILMGDLNDIEGSIMYERAILDFDDVKYQAPKTMESNSYNGWGKIDGAKKKSPIDFIFMSKSGFQALSYKVINTLTSEGTYRSDHFPLVAELQLI